MTMLQLKISMDRMTDNVWETLCCLWFKCTELLDFMNTNTLDQDQWSDKVTAYVISF